VIDVLGLTPAAGRDFALDFSVEQKVHVLTDA
jgi:hypothetical protein